MSILCSLLGHVEYTKRIYPSKRAVGGINRKKSQTYCLRCKKLLYDLYDEDEVDLSWKTKSLF